jgi:hypothetical protein
VPGRPASHENLGPNRKASTSVQYGQGYGKLKKGDIFGSKADIAATKSI